MEQLVQRWALREIEHERKKEALGRWRQQLEIERAGGDRFTAPATPSVTVRDDHEARKIADNPLPGTENDPEWAEWERQQLDPTKDL